MSNVVLYDGDDSYANFTSYSDSEDPYRPHSVTEQSSGNLSGTPLSSDVEESPRGAFPRESMLAPRMTQEWVRAERLDSSPGISRRRPGVTFKEGPIIHIVPPASPGIRPKDLYEPHIG